jgi:hypothetical protein
VHGVAIVGIVGEENSVWEAVSGSDFCSSCSHKDLFFFYSWACCAKDPHISVESLLRQILRLSTTGPNSCMHGSGYYRSWKKEGVNRKLE